MVKGSGELAPHARISGRQVTWWRTHSTNKRILPGDDTVEILILGGTGFLSSVVAEVACDAGQAVTIFTRGRSRRPAPAGVTALVGDRRDRDAFRKLFAGRRYDAVIDCICYSAEDAVTDVAAFDGRVGHLVMISTDFVYGGEPRHFPLAEGAPREPMGGYGRGKVAAEERFFAAWREQQFPVTLLRPPHIMGAGGLLGTGSLRGRDAGLLGRLHTEEPVVLLDDGALLIQPVVHRDIAAAALATLGKPATYGEAYNVAGEEVLTTRRYYEIIAEELGVELHALSLPSSVYLAAFPDRAPFAQHRLYDTRKLARDTGFTPRVGVREAIREMIAWLDANPASAAANGSAERRLVAAIERHQEDLLQLLKE
jgi:nucleoside-diphosphate-sugar epimerase